MQEDVSEKQSSNNPEISQLVNLPLVYTCKKQKPYHHCTNFN